MPYVCASLQGNKGGSDPPAPAVARRYVSAVARAVSRCESKRTGRRARAWAIPRAHAPHRGTHPGPPYYGLRGLPRARTTATARARSEVSVVRWVQSVTWNSRQTHCRHAMRLYRAVPRHTVQTCTQGSVRTYSTDMLATISCLHAALAHASRTLSMVKHKSAYAL